MFVIVPKRTEVFGMTKSEKHDPLPPHVARVIHDVVRKHVTIPSDLEHLGPLAELGHRHFQMATGLVLEEHPMLHAEIITFMKQRGIYPSNHPEFASVNRLSAIRKIDAALPEAIKQVLMTNNVEVVQHNDPPQFDLNAQTDQPLST